MKRIILLIAGVILMSNCKSGSDEATKVDISSNSLYKSEEGKKLSHRSYNKAMELWPVEYKEDWIETSYGETHIVVSGKENLKPLFLLPALFSDATMWYPNVEELSREYRVFAVDSLIYGGKSTPSGKNITCIKDFSVWFKELLSHYNYKKTAIAGLSYSGWLSLALSNEIPENISATVILDPSTTFMKMDGGIGWRGFWAFVFFPTDKKKNDFFNWMGGGYIDPEMAIWFEHMMNVVNHGSVTNDKVPQHKTYTPEELEGVKAPTLILIGGKKILYKDPGKLAKKATLALPHAEVEIVPDAGHIINIEKSKYINRRMISFLKKNY